MSLSTEDLHTEEEWRAMHWMYTLGTKYESPDAPVKDVEEEEEENADS